MTAPEPLNKEEINRTRRLDKVTQSLYLNPDGTLKIEFNNVDVFDLGVLFQEKVADLIVGRWSEANLRDENLKDLGKDK